MKFLDKFPISLSDLDFDATDSDIDYLTADDTFKYTIYNITDLNDNILGILILILFKRCGRKMQR